MDNARGRVTRRSMQPFSERMEASRRSITEADRARHLHNALVVAKGNHEYAQELADQLVSAQAASDRRLEIMEAILRLVERGLVIDSGERRHGQIVWCAAPTSH